VWRPGATSRIFGSELTTIDAVAMSPCTPPRASSSTPEIRDLHGVE
jgi:hypothetical protein